MEQQNYAVTLYDSVIILAIRHGSTSIWHMSEASETRSFPPSNEKVNIFQLAVISFGTPGLFLHFCLLTICYSI